MDIHEQVAQKLYQNDPQFKSTAKWCGLRVLLRKGYRKQAQAILDLISSTLPEWGLTDEEIQQVCDNCTHSMWDDIEEAYRCVFASHNRVLCEKHLQAQLTKIQRELMGGK